MKKVLIKSFGCQMNKLDTSLVMSSLKKAGYETTESLGDADLVLMNTCSVREHAEERVISNLGHLKHARKSRPQLMVAVMGCMAQRLGEELLKHPAVDIVCGPGQIGQLTDMLEEAEGHKSKQLAVKEKIREKVSDEEASVMDEFELANNVDEDNQIPNQVFVRAMRGCNNFCTYCIVPYVRGPEASRAPASIIEQVKDLAAKGNKQITLLGQTINSYSYDENRKHVGLAQLLEMLHDIDGIEWIKFITSYPADFDENILHVMAKLPKICHYLHIPAQSGSDRILKAMNRHYTAAEYLAILDRARQIVPDIAIASDFIVGFSGETDEDFAATVELVRKAQFKNSFIFKYSPRPGTHSDKKMADDVSEDVKKERNAILLNVQNEISEAYNKRFVGQKMRVLVENQSTKGHLNNTQDNPLPQLISRTGTDYIVVFNGPASLVGNFAEVIIERTSALTLFGRL